jgi:4-diphosphocytidyl-2-C-methyl-D-erythritol kinase
MTLTVRAHAKINLELRLLGPRPDGYHEIRTVYQSLALHDVLVFRRRPGPFALRCRGAGLPADPTNLIWRAAAGLWRFAGRSGEPSGIAVALRKKIPVQAGLGGGSSDAAATLVALNRLWRLGLPAEALQRVAATLGADVPYFLVGGTALGLGRGDDLYPLVDAPRYSVVLVCFDSGVSTREAYRWYDEDTAGGSETLAGVGFSVVRWAGCRLVVTNAFEPVVGRRLPQVLAAKQALLDAGAVAATLAGSGSAVFGLFMTLAAARRAAAVARQTGCLALVTSTVRRGEFLRGQRGRVASAFVSGVAR